MVTLFGIFNIGSQSLGAQQRGLSVTADNIANVNTDGYTRQRVTLTTGTPIGAPEGMYGTGVRVDGVERLRDAVLESQVRLQVSAEAFYRGTRTGYDQLQAVLTPSLGSVDGLDTSGAGGIDAALGALFDAFSELSLAPESLDVRQVVLQEAENVSGAFRTARNELTAYQSSLNGQITAMVDEVNRIAGQVADLNARIVREELGGLRGANTLRDERGRLLNRLSELVPVTTTETETGSVNVSVGGSLLVSNDRAMTLQALQRENDPLRSYDIVLASSGTRVLNASLDGGKLGGLLAVRDEIIPGYIKDLDTLASAVIGEINRIHAGSVGLVGFDSVTASVPARDATVPLASAGYSFPLVSGSLSIRVTGSDGTEIATYEIDVDPSTDSLEDLAARIDAADGVPGGGDVTASVNPDGTLTLSAGNGERIAFTDDSSGFLAAAGINTFFTGTDAATIGVADAIASDPRLIAASATGEVGNNAAALELAALRDASVMEDGSSLTGFYRGIVTRVGVEASHAAELESAAGLMTDSLQARQEELSGVSLDEEAVNMMRYQRAFEAAARLISAVDEMLATVLGMGG